MQGGKQQHPGLVSNYGPDSWTLQNTGDKRIAAVFIAVTNSLFSDVVFDAIGIGGDSNTKPLTYESGSDIVGAVIGTYYPYLWLTFQAGGGFHGQLLLFDNFTSNKQVGFSGDMNSNSLAGLSKASVDLAAS